MQIRDARCPTGVPSPSKRCVWPELGKMFLGKINEYYSGLQVIPPKGTVLRFVSLATVGLCYFHRSPPNAALVFNHEL